MIKREIYIVYAYVVDANGNCNQLTGYPKTFDSKNYENDIKKAERRAYSEYHSVVSAMGKRDDRQLQSAFVMSASNNMLFERYIDGAIADLPDPEAEE